jgi:hypothetical protein
MSKHIVTVLMILMLAYSEWRLWPRKMAVYHAKPMMQNPTEAPNFVDMSYYSGNINWAKVTCTASEP